MSRKAVHFAAELTGLATLGTGLWWFAPWLCLTAVGGIILAASVAGRRA